MPCVTRNDSFADVVLIDRHYVLWIGVRDLKVSPLDGCPKRTGKMFGGLPRWQSFHKDFHLLWKAYSNSFTHTSWKWPVVIDVYCTGRARTIFIWPPFRGGMRARYELPLCVHTLMSAAVVVVRRIVCLYIGSNSILWKTAAATHRHIVVVCIYTL